MNAGINLTLKSDQIFGLHACVPAEAADAFGAVLDESGLPFSRGWTGASRLDVPGHATFFFHEIEKEVRWTLTDRLPAISVAEGVETLPPRYGPPLAQLLEIGVPESSADDPEGCDRWGFTAQDIPALLGLARDPELQVASSESTAVWAPIHAIRALGWLRAEAAIAPLAAEWAGPESRTTTMGRMRLRLRSRPSGRPACRPRPRLSPTQAAASGPAWRRRAPSRGSRPPIPPHARRAWRRSWGSSTRIRCKPPISTACLFPP